jgi:membrane protease YdiL (CAAX protease family)
MYALSEVIRVSYHMYYQAVGPSVLVMGAVNVWLYRRTRRLAPIICAHILTDVQAWLQQYGPAGITASVAASCIALALINKFWLTEPAEPDDDLSTMSPSSVEESVQ